MSLQAMFKNAINDCLHNPDFVTETRIGLAHEILNLQIQSNDTSDYIFPDQRINRIKYDYAEQFWDFMISGGTDAEEAFEKYPNVAKFIQKPKSDLLPANFNTLYGPRIVKQYDNLIKELKTPGSRRGTILILSEDDQVIFNTNETIEYPCTIAFHFTVRDNKLFLSTVMRSQNLATVLQLDIFLQVKLLHKIAKDLSIPTENTVYNATLINAHLFNRDFDYVSSFLD